MKNLKKVLALVLVVAMMASFAVGASAAFTDADKITYTTAVDVLTGLKVINGYTDGSFHPTDNVTRGAFAKMVGYVMNSGKDAATSYGTAAATAFSDVSATSKFGPSIGFCTSQGIISGYSDGTFKADRNVTGVQAAKMLLGALGYDSSIEGYTGAKWSLNVLSDAEDAGLFKGMSTVDMTKPLSREAAAQMIWNALQATVVKYDNGGMTITTGNTTITTGASAAKAVENDAKVQFKANGKLELVEKYFPDLKTAASTYDEYGRPGVEYKLGTKTIATAIETPAATYTATVLSGKVYSDLGLSEKVEKLEVVVNHKANANRSTKTLTVEKNGKVEIGGNGILTEVYTDADGVPTKIVEVAPSVATVTNVSSRNATRTTGAYTLYTLKVGDETKNVKVFSSVVNAEADKDTGVITGTVAAKDTVLYYVTNDDNQHVVATTPVTGVLTSKTSAGVYTIGGEKYELAAAAGDLSLSVSKNEQTVYVDEYGYIVAGKAAEAEVESYGLFVGADYTVSLNNNKLEYVYTVSVVNTDGEVTALNVNRTTYDSYATEGSLKTSKVVEYTLNTTTGLYTIADASVAAPAAAYTVTKIVKGATTLTVSSSDKVYANASTKFVFPNKTAGKLNGTANIITGVANVGSYNTVTATAIDLNNDKIADVVFVTDGKETNTISSLTYVVGTYTTTVDGKVYDVIIDGEASTVTVKAAASLDPGMYREITVTDGTPDATLATDTGDDQLTAYTSVKYSGGLIFCGDVMMGSATDTTPVYTIDAKDGYAETLTAANIAAGMDGTQIFVLTNKGTGAVTAVYVVYTTAPAKD